MLNLTLKNIFYKKTRSILTIMGIVIALQLYIVLSGIMNAYDKDMQKQVSSMAGKVYIQAKNEGNINMFPIQTFVDENTANQMFNIKDIDASRSTKVLYNEVVPAQAPNMPPLVFIAGVEVGKESVYYVNAELKSKLVNTNDVILGATAANWVLKEHNAKLNDTFVLNNQKLKIIGILPTITMMIDSSIIMPIDTAQKMYSKEGLVNTIILTATNSKDVERIAKEINDSYSKVNASTTKEMQKTADKMLAGQRAFFAMINNTIIFVAIFMIMIIMVMAIHERKKEIGTLKAIGASFPKLLIMVMSESTILSIIGGIIALPASIVFTWVIFALSDSSTTINTVFTYNDPKTWPMIVVVAVIIGVVSGIFPALSARKVNPLESIRYE